MEDIMQKSIKLVSMISFLVLSLFSFKVVADDTASFSSEQRDAFVQAYLQVNQIQQEYHAQLDPEMTEEQMQKVANKANERIESAIDAQENMNTDVYRQILVAIENDQDLLNDIQQRLQNL